MDISLRRRCVDKYYQQTGIRGNINRQVKTSQNTVNGGFSYELSTAINATEWVIFRAHNPKVVGSHPTPATNEHRINPVFAPPARSRGIGVIPTLAIM